jgi:threonine dehydrogenase-like Zn-dependent dehydrogenase
MRALSVIPGKPNSAGLMNLSQPVGDSHGVRLDPLCVGICGTDHEIVAGEYGRPPPDRKQLVIGHECVARIADPHSDFERGELVVPIVRRPDPVPCAACAVDQWDMCLNGRYTEHGIKALDGFCAEALRVDPRFLVRVPDALGRRAVLVEPTSIVAKSWEHIEHIGRRAYWSPRRVLVTGAGPVGLLAGLLGRQRGFDVMLFDRVATGSRPRLARKLGAQFSSEPLRELLAEWPPDIVLECTGADAVVLEVIRHTKPGCVVCLVGVSEAGHSVAVDLGALNRSIVLENDVVFGSVNANRRHYERAVEALAEADQSWLDALITRRVALDDWHDALRRQPDDVKVLIEIMP